jgi:hypothetical protein
MSDCRTCGSCGMDETPLTRLLRMEPCTYGCACVGDEYAWHPRSWRNYVLEVWWTIAASVRWALAGFPKEDGL